MANVNISNVPNIKFNSVKNSFHAELKKRTSEYFQQVGKSPTGDQKIVIKAIILFAAFIGLYIHLVFFTPGVIWAITECLLLGAVVSSIGFNVMHDGGHGSFSKYKSVNTFAALTLNILGGNAFMWNQKHNIIHHAFTNVDGVDEDINIPFMRLSSTQSKSRLHKYQHLYFWVLYSLLYIFWMFVSDYKKYFRGKVSNQALKPMKLSDHLIFWGFKLLHAFIFVALPIYMLGFSQWVVGFLVFTLFAGFVLSIVFQLAHTVEHTAFPVPDKITNKLEDEWAIHQIKTTANFATRNKIVNWFVGGLNFQVEHHLFPRISHVHYPAISKIVKQACKEYGIAYIEYKRMTQAVISHVMYLRQMGRA
jgi:linoleoyl-CoA desaturase